MIELKKAQRKSAKLRLGMASPSGGGKTLGSLLIAYGLMKESYPNLSGDKLWEKIAIIDTENGSGELYVGKEIGNVKIGHYNAITLTAPFEAEKYISALEVCEDAKMEVVIIDSTTHLWSGTGGLLEQQGNIAKRTGNSWTAWRDVTPMHNRFVEKMLQCNNHLIATMRSKTDYVQEKDSTSGKTTVKKVGMNPIQKDGMEYEFTTFFDIDAEHMAFGSKDRTSLFDQKYFTITPKTGQELMQWLNSGTDEKKEVIAVSKADPKEALKELSGYVVDLCKELGGSKNDSLMKILKEFEPSGNPNKIKDSEKLQQLKEKLEELKEGATKNA
jgi:hypothetical protein